MSPVTTNAERIDVFNSPGETSPTLPRGRLRGRNPLLGETEANGPSTTVFTRIFWGPWTAELKDDGSSCSAHIGRAPPAGAESDRLRDRHPAAAAEFDSLRPPTGCGSLRQ